MRVYVYIDTDMFTEKKVLKFKVIFLSPIRKSKKNPQTTILCSAVFPCVILELSAETSYEDFPSPRI